MVTSPLLVSGSYVISNLLPARFSTKEGFGKRRHVSKIVRKLLSPARTFHASYRSAHLWLQVLSIQRFWLNYRFLRNQSLDFVTGLVNSSYSSCEGCWTPAFYLCPKMAALLCLHYFLRLNTVRPESNSQVCPTGSLQESRTFTRIVMRQKQRTE